MGVRLQPYIANSTSRPDTPSDAAAHAVRAGSTYGVRAVAYVRAAGSSIARTTMPPTMREPSQIPRLVRSTCRSLDPNGETSSTISSQAQLVGMYGDVEYSGRCSANGLTRRPSAV